MKKAISNIKIEAINESYCLTQYTNQNTNVNKKN